VVTGGAGFLGSHLVDLLLERGHRVTVLDNLVTGSMENLAHLVGRESFRFVKQDVTEYLFVEGRVDFVWHLASPASPVDYAELPIQTLKVGGLGTHKALGLARAKGARFLFTSTSEVYGDPEVHPQSENYWGHVNPVGPRSCYDEAKRFGEALTMAYQREHGVDTRIVRIFNTYGPRMRLGDGRVVPAFVGDALAGRPLTLFGKGEQTRSFCYVTDLIEGLWRTMQCSDRSVHEPINLGNPTEMTIREFAELVRRVAGSKSRIVFRPLPQDDPRQRRPDISRARRLLRWEPEVGLEAGLRRTIDYFCGQRRNKPV
jgi:dTDP-glucose 4,6-dehydratase